MNTQMEVNGLKCTFHLPQAVKRVKNLDGSEGIAPLPPYAARVAYPVDEYPASPSGWMHGSGKASSYFVPVEANHGMWLDFNANAYHTHDIAIVVSVQGINPLTGLKSDPIRLEQYKEMCPKHQRDFKQDRFCEDCNYKWHAQNYIASNVTPSGYFWIDGFRAEDGVIRQWYFTEEECKGIAAQVIGAERVYAIGIAFYLSKKPKPQPVYRATRGGGGIYGQAMGMTAGGFCGSLGGGSYSGGGGTYACSGGYQPSVEVFHSLDLTGDSFIGNSYNDTLDYNAEAAAIENEQTLLEIGAGAKINQKIYTDHENLDYWQDEPAGFIYVNYCDQVTTNKILAAGKRQVSADGFMSGLNLKDA